MIIGATIVISVLSGVALGTSYAVGTKQVDARLFSLSLTYSGHNWPISVVIRDGS